MYTEKQDTNTSQMNVNDPHSLDYSKNEQLIENRPVTETPFRVMGTPEKGYSVVVGNCVISKPFPTPEDAEKFVRGDTWEFRCAVMSGMIAIEREIHERIEADKAKRIQNDIQKELTKQMNNQ